MNREVQLRIQADVDEFIRDLLASEASTEDVIYALLDAANAELDEAERLMGDGNQGDG